MKTLLPPIWGMSGVQNFFGEGFPFHRICTQLFGKRFTFNGVLFVAKTTTLLSNKGNMPMREDGVTPKEFRPACIIIGPWQFLLGVLLNAVGLSGPGALSLLRRNIWQKMTQPFMISFMSIAKGATDEDTVRIHLAEFQHFCVMLSEHRHQFLAQFFSQVNISCPNVKAGKKSDAIILKEGLGYLEIQARSLPDVQIVFKINTLMQPEAAVKLSEHPQCAGVCVTNAFPWSTLTWFQKALYFPLSIFTGKSPLDHLGGGGLSGRPLLKEVEVWVRKARQAGFKKHINAGGGILCANHVDRLKKAGADSVSIASVALLRPWRLRSIIARAYTVFDGSCML
ncbi:MAG: hypothetical protein WAV46_02030 [Candidatus Moraniibacteriota bacterium]